MDKKIYVILPKNISHSVWEALNLHINYMKENGYQVIFASHGNLQNYSGNEEVLTFNTLREMLSFFINAKPVHLYVITVIEAFWVFLINTFNSKHKVYFWVQGLIDHEDYLQHKNILRKLAFKVLMRLSGIVAQRYIAVTNEMVRVLEKNYGFKKNESIVVSCGSRLNLVPNERVPKSVCYIGGLSKWQNVDKVIHYFKELHRLDNDYHFFLATYDHKKANELLQTILPDEVILENVTLLSLKEKSEVEAFLSKMEYGFLLRDDILLNNVASPIKLAEYLSCGVNVILSSALKDFAPLVNKYSCGVVVDQNAPEKDVNKVVQYKYSAENALTLYQKLYSEEEFINRYHKILI